MEGPLRPEDGARFNGTIERLDEGYRASFHLLLDNLSEVATQQGDMELFNSEADAERWLHAQAAARGFTKIELKRPG